MQAKWAELVSMIILHFNDFNFKKRGYTPFLTMRLSMLSFCIRFATANHRV